jgi:hypothetical protein
MITSNAAILHALLQVIAGSFLGFFIAVMFHGILAVSRGSAN